MATLLNTRRAAETAEMEGAKKPRRVNIFLAALAVFLFTLYGGSKGIIGGISVQDIYIRNNGSFVTNGAIYVSIVKTLELVPDDTEIMIWQRELASTNAEDWTELTPRHIYSEFPLWIQVANATNFNFLVAANFIPIPTHTNGVWSMNGFIIPGGDGTKYAFPTATTKRIEQ